MSDLEARISGIESYLQELGAFLNSSGAGQLGVQVAGRAAGAAIGDPNLLAQVSAITRWIQEAAGTTIVPDPEILRSQAGAISQPKSGPGSPGYVGPAPIQYPASPGSDQPLWGVGPGVTTQSQGPTPGQTPLPFATGVSVPASPFGSNPALAGTVPRSTAAAVAALR